ncbi:hypothetical protein [Streptomyces sp. LUP30]|uniref:hypothetical protein n=1 Tax=Streptomyces sp. LUP30 TaxID=1890285 RepID=UPI00085200EF|nr:hypothetical protein [Streptomyces sp. LUP30]
MSENPVSPAAPAAPSGLRGWSCCLLPAVLTLGWFLGARFLPERVAWYPIWLAAALWNGSDGHGGVSHLLGRGFPGPLS